MLDFYSNNFHIFRFSRSGKREVDVNRLMSKHSSNYNVPFVTIPCHNSPSMRHHTWSWYIQGQIPHDFTLLYEIKVNVSLGTRRCSCSVQLKIPSVKIQIFFVIDHSRGVYIISFAKCLDWIVREKESNSSFLATAHALHLTGILLVTKKKLRIAGFFALLPFLTYLCN